MNVCADHKPDACIVDVRDGLDHTINCQCAVEGHEVREMFLICNIELCCNSGFTQFEVEVDSRQSDLNFGALLDGDKFDKVGYFEGAINNIVDGGRIQPRKMGVDKLNGKGAGRTIARDIELTPWSRALGLLDEVCEFIFE